MTGPTTTAVIVDAVRTPVGRHMGRLSGWHAADLAAHTLAALVARHDLDPALVDDVILGCATQVGDQAFNVARSAVLAAGWPESVPGTTVDRQCGSGQQAVHFAAQGVSAGVYDLVVAGGVEVMSATPLGASVVEGGTAWGPGVLTRYAGVSHVDGWRGLVPPGISAEIVAERWGLTRDDLDAIALGSHQRAARARDEGRWTGQIVPTPVRGRPAAGATGGVLDVDECIHEASAASLAALEPAFLRAGRITAGNSSPVGDGAAAVLVASEETATRLGLPVRARFVTFAVSGVDPVTALGATVPATERALARAGLALDDLDVCEVDEGFAATLGVWLAGTGADPERVNGSGGSIALGNPLGATGVRLVASVVDELTRTGGRYGLATVCEGGGMANATIIERAR